MNALSEIIWVVWILTGLAWEITTVLMEKRDRRFEPLTRVYRDRLMRNHKAGIIFRLIFLSFWGWLALHWLVPLEW